METRYVTIRMPEAVETELQLLKRMKGQTLIYIVEDAINLNRLVEVPWTDVLSKTIVMRAHTHYKAKKMGEDLELGLSRYIAYVIHGYCLNIKDEFAIYLRQLPDCIAMLKEAKESIDKVNTFLAGYQGPSNWLMQAEEKLYKEIKHLDMQHRELTKLKIK